MAMQRRWRTRGGDGRQPHATRSASSLLPQSVRARICEAVCGYLLSHTVGVKGVYYW